MRAEIMTFLSVLTIGFTVQAESIKEKFDRINSERAQNGIEAGNKKAILSGIQAIGIDTANMNLQLDDNSFNYASDGKFACEFAVYMFYVEPLNIDDQTAYQEAIRKIYNNALRCEKISSSVGSPREDYRHGVEVRRALEFASNASAAIAKAGANPSEFMIPSDFRTRESVESPLWTEGLYLEGAHSICKLTSHMNLDVSAVCVKKSASNLFTLKN